MIAAVDHEHKVAWGYGKTRAEALAMAEAELAEKNDPAALRWKKLDYCELAPDADLDGCGETIYEGIILEDDTQQMGFELEGGAA